ncbi:hypothetical protein Psyc_0439 [Psychrobacter arcticus 273-4]|uniref:Uncharacterized protein n=1 Tax=Psychrobacter arcticus (strain DSM 17307 / VKM B-2377 / 273-4) TaxID=259536 RepID=Q4FUK6_PSYA2|nr:hypothetical protein [Psychrobacter arcticus]AAZ18302.1 hypothetical protein Psyc_0439 [Psychrobacter arcticus 273-4]
MTVKILIELAWRYWHWFVIAALVVIITALSIVYVQRGYAIDAIKAKHELVLATERADYESSARQIEQQNYQGVINAVNQSTVRQKQIADKYDSVVVINDSLSDSIANIETSLISANRSAVIDYTKSVNGLFAECSTQYLAMAKSAAREQEEARRLREAWPKR